MRACTHPGGLGTPIAIESAHHFWLGGGKNSHKFDLCCCWCRRGSTEPPIFGSPIRRSTHWATPVSPPVRSPLAVQEAMVCVMGGCGKRYLVSLLGFLGLLLSVGFRTDFSLVMTHIASDNHTHLEAPQDFVITVSCSLFTFFRFNFFKCIW